MTTMEHVKALKDTECIVDVLLNEVRKNECKTCGKCTFGYEGINQLEMILSDITEKKGRPGDVELMDDLCQVMKEQSLCEKGEEIAAAVLETISAYRKDFDDHIGKRGCRAGVCKKYMTYHIEACPKNFNAGAAAEKKTGSAAPAAAPADYTWRQMLAEARFYLMLIVLMCGAFGGMMIISQASPLAQNMMGFTPAAAAAVVSILAFFNMLGRLASGMISDKLGAEGTLRITFSLSIIACIFLFFCGAGKNAMFYIGLSAVGFSFGSIMGIYPGYTAKQFGRKNNSVNYGIMFIGFALAGLFGPMIMNTIHNATGKYQPAFLVSAALGAVGLALVFVLNAKFRKKD